MPIHSFKCGLCTTEFEKYQSLNELKELEPCPNCGVEAKKLFKSSAKPILFKEGFYEIDDGDKDPYITSLKQLKEECSKRGLVSRYILDSGLNIKTKEAK